MNDKEFEPDHICEEADGCPTEGAVLKRFWRENQPDKVLLDFYQVSDYPSLTRELVDHVTQLQDAARRNVKPWEDTMPPTLLPAYIAQFKKSDNEAAALIAAAPDLLYALERLVVLAGDRLSIPETYAMRDLLATAKGESK